MDNLEKYIVRLITKQSRAQILISIPLMILGVIMGMVVYNILVTEGTFFYIAPFISLTAIVASILLFYSGVKNRNPKNSELYQILFDSTKNLNEVFTKINYKLGSVTVVANYLVHFITKDKKDVTLAISDKKDLDQLINLLKNNFKEISFDSANPN